MKKFLLMAAIAAGTMTANAQMKLNHVNIQKPTDKVVWGTAMNEDLTRALEVPNMYYYRPMGMFYTGWNKGFYNPGLSYIPMNTDIHFEANMVDGTPAWAYPDGKYDSTGEPAVAEWQGNTLDLNLPEGKFFTPMLVNMDDQNGDRFVPAGYMEVGGQSYIGDMENEQGELVCGDAFAVNYVSTGSLGSMAGLITTHDDEANATFEKYVWGEPFETLGFGEQFISNADFEVKGFNALIVAQEDIIKRQDKVSAFIYKFLPEQQPEILADNETLELEITEVQAPSDGFGLYHFHYSVKGDPIKVKANDVIAPFFEAKKVKLSPCYDSQPRWDETIEKTQGITTKLVLARTAGSEIITSIPSLAFQNQETGEKGYVNSWCIGIDMSYAKNGFAGIDNVVADEVAGNGAVYTVEGVKVSNGDVENLPAGVYVKDGKKFVVR